MKTKPSLLILLSLFILTPVANAQEQPVLQVVDFSNVPYEEISRNGALEEVSGNRFAGVQFFQAGYQVKPNEGRNGSTAAYCENPDGSRRLGLSWTFALNRKQVQPIRFEGWSRAESVEGAPDGDYSLYIDIVHQDGTPSWGHISPFQTGSHDWEKQTLLILPDQPVKSLSCYALFRNHKGKVWFDDFTVQVARPPEGMIRLDSLFTKPIQPMEAAQEGQIFTTQDGLSLRMNSASGAISSVSVSGVNVPLAATVNGFLVRDVGAGSDYFSFPNGQCNSLKCELDITLQELEHAIHIRGKLKDQTAAPRAMNLIYSIPVSALGWKWGDPARKPVTITENMEFSNWLTLGTGSNGKISRYPFASVHSDQAGLGLGIDMGRPCQWRLGYSAGAGALYLSMDFGLHPDTRNFPSQAEFELVLFPVNPAWGFRSAAEQYYRIFPSYFTVRSREQGIWMPFTDIKTVQGWQDFGFMYHEGTNNIPFDDASGILSFRYAEPSTWWMSMAKDIPRTYEEAIRLVEQHAKSTNTNQRARANSLLTSGSYDSEGRYQMLFRNEPWTNGAVFSLNPSPYIEGEYTHASMMWNEKLAANLYGPNAKGVQDGEYLDSLEGYVTADLNFRPDHFRVAATPLTFTLDTRQPVIHKGFSQYEFTRYINEEMHSRNKLLFANSVPYRFGFLCPWIDIMGTEANWVRNGQFSPDSDEVMIYRRVLCAQKPFLYLMNTNFENMTSPIVEQYFQYCLFYGMFPSMFSHNASEDPYWQNPTLYNRDRPLFQKYQPIIKQVAEAGWQPVTLAGSDQYSVWVERFGVPENKEFFFTVMNTNPVEQSFSLSGDPVLQRRGQWKELLSEGEGNWDGGLRSRIPGKAVQVYQVFNLEEGSSVSEWADKR